MSILDKYDDFIYKNKDPSKWAPEHKIAMFSKTTLNNFN
jgi:hypothetical protein